MTLLIQAANVDYAYGGHAVLEGATFEIRQGDRLALIGANGSGKSTLFRLMASLSKPDRGAITVSRGVRSGFLKQEPDFDPHQTVREAIALAAGDPAALEQRAHELESAMGQAASDDELTAIMDEYALVLERLDSGAGDTSKGARVLAGLGIAESRGDQPIGQLSGGEKKLIGLARLLVEEPDVLLLDEPDNHLDFAGKRWLEEFIRDHHREGAVAVISHDRYFIDRIANRIFELEGGQHHRLHRQLRRLRGREAGSPGAWRPATGAAGTRAPQAEGECGTTHPMGATESEVRPPGREHAPQTGRGARAPRTDSGSRPQSAPDRRCLRRRARLDARPGGEGPAARASASGSCFEPFDFEIRHGEAVGLVGANGSGKTTLFRIVRGEETPSGGTLRLGPSVVLGYYAQEQETLDPAVTPMDLVRKLKPMSEQGAIGFLNRYLFTRDDMLNRIGALSGGQRARLQIAALILQGANFLLLDEPTNNLDIASVERLEEALLSFLDDGRGSILTISHDRAFLDTICSRIVELDTGVVRDYAGGFTYYDEHRAHGRELTIRPPAPPPPPKNPRRQDRVAVTRR